MDKQAAMEQLEALAALDGGLKVKGKAMPYLAVNGNMFAFADDEGLAIRLSKEDRAAWVEAGQDGADVIKYGSVMRGYVRASAEVLADEGQRETWFRACLAGAHALPPKPTTRKKS